MTRAGGRGAAVTPAPVPAPDAEVLTADPPADHASTRPGADGGLASSAARGAVATLTGQVAQIVMQMALVVVLARLLTPRDYGLYAMVLVIVGVGAIFRDFGLSSAAIQAKTLSRGQRDNLFWINTASGAGLTVLVFACAPLVADLFGQPKLVPITRVLSIVFVLDGMSTQHRANLKRAMRFKQLAITDVVAQVVNVSVAISSAALGAGYWALVWSQVAQVATALVMAVVFTRWIPGRPVRGEPMRPLLLFGLHFVGTQLIYYASSNVDTVTIGLRFGPSSLGIYNRAFQFLMNPLNQFRVPASTVAIPVLSRLQDDLERANVYLRRSQTVLGCTVVLALSYAAGAAVPLVHVFLGARWHAVSPIFALLAFAGIFQMLSFVGYWAYVSRGLTHVLLRYTVVSFALKAVCVVVGSYWGIIGVAAGFAVAPAFAWPLSLGWLARHSPIPLRALNVGGGRIIGVAAWVFTCTFLTAHQLSDDNAVLGAGVSLLAGAAALGMAGALIPAVRRDLLVTVDFVRKVRR